MDGDDDDDHDEDAYEKDEGCDEDKTDDADDDVEEFEQLEDAIALNDVGVTCVDSDETRLDEEVDEKDEHDPTAIMNAEDEDEKEAEEEDNDDADENAGGEEDKTAEGKRNNDGKRGSVGEGECTNEVGEGKTVSVDRRESNVRKLRDGEVGVAGTVNMGELVSVQDDDETEDVEDEDTNRYDDDDDDEAEEVAKDDEAKMSDETEDERSEDEHDEADAMGCISICVVMSFSPSGNSE